MTDVDRVREAMTKGIDAIIRSEPLTLDECVNRREEMVQALTLLDGKVLVREDRIKVPRDCYGCPAFRSCNVPCIKWQPADKQRCREEYFAYLTEGSGDGTTSTLD